MIADAHCHFFSPGLFEALARESGGPGTPGAAVAERLGWEAPVSADDLADRWILELDHQGVNRAVLIASVPGDETAVAAAVARHPSRIIGAFMVDPRGADAPARVRRALTDLGLRYVCLFPAMHHVAVTDDRSMAVLDTAAGVAGSAAFVHCGALSVGVRRKLGLPSRFDLRLGDPLAVHAAALTFPRLPFVIPHFGAGFFREALMAADLAANIQLDTSSSNGWMRYAGIDGLGEVFRTALAVTGPDRLLFGTDSSFFPRGWQRPIFEAQRQALQAIGVAADDQALIFGGNLARLFPV
jgi:predicted TIM-barrel fold metal-dependent hydrolase